MLDSIKEFFSHSETIFLARLETLVGFTIAATGAMDWSPLLALDFGTGFSKSQAVATGLIVLVHGVVIELARRRNSSMDPISAI